MTTLCELVAEHLPHTKYGQGVLVRLNQEYTDCGGGTHEAGLYRVIDAGYSEAHGNYLVMQITHYNGERHDGDCPFTFLKKWDAPLWTLAEPGDLDAQRRGTLTPRPDCVCGAHAVGVNTHSAWCDILKA